MTDKEQIISIEKSLRYISAHVRAHGREILKEYELSPLQFVALQWVGDKDDITIGTLSSRLYLAHSTTTDIVDKLEDNGFVKRYKSDRDKRLVLIKMEDKGKEIISAVIAKRVSYISQITSHLSNGDKEILPSVLESILHESEKYFHE